MIGVENMSSETTKYYGLPQYKLGDHPDFLNEINKGYATIDTNLHDLHEDYEQLANDTEVLNNEIKELLARFERLELLSTTVVQEGE